MTPRIAATLLLLLLRRLCTPSTLPNVATLPLLLKIYMQQAMESLSRDDSQQRDRDPERSSGQRPKVNDRDVDHRRFPVFDLKDLSDLKALRTLLCVAEGRMSREDNALAEGLIGTEPRGVAKAMSYQRRALTI